MKRYKYHTHDDKRFLFMQCEDEAMAVRIVMEIVKPTEIPTLDHGYTNPSMVGIFDNHKGERGYVDVTRRQGYSSLFQPYVTREEKIDNLLE